MGERPHRASSRAAAYVVIAFAVLWNLISLPAALIVPGEVAKGNMAAAFALLFPFVGLGLAAWAVRAWLQMKRFKTPTLSLQRMPVALGGRLKASLRVEAPVPVTTDFALELECVEVSTRGTGKNRKTEEKILWQKQWRVPRHQCQAGPAFTTIPVEVAVPADQPATTLDSDSDKILWRLEATGECPGPDFWSEVRVARLHDGRHAGARGCGLACRRARRTAEHASARRARHRLHAHAARR